MSILQEYISSFIGIAVGIYEQITANFHAYTEILERIPKPPFDGCPYSVGKHKIKPSSLVDNKATFQKELERFVSTGAQAGVSYDNLFLQDTAQIMDRSWKMYKMKKLQDALDIAKLIAAPDWRLACVEWLQRRIARRETLEQ